MAPLTNNYLLQLPVRIETWTLNAELEKKINAFELRTYRRLLQIPYTAHVTNERVLKQIKDAAGPFDRLLEIVKRRILVWFGHVTRRNGLSKTVLQGSVNATRSRGRPRKTWYDNIAKWTGLNSYDTNRVAQRRTEWRHISYEASRTRAPTITAVTG